jgi:hypothetical protein
MHRQTSRHNDPHELLGPQTLSVEMRTPQQQ